MSTLRPRTLEDLRQDANAAWLWDAARGRIVWANPAGVAVMGGESVFDLVDRPFDLNDASVQAIRDLAGQLASGQVRPVKLALPGAVSGDTMAVHCSLHLLADGRQGVLVVAEPPPKSLPPVAEGVAQTALLHLPVAVIICDGSGHVLHGNDAAKAMLDLGTLRSLAEAALAPGRVESLFADLHRTGVTSAVVAMTCVLGQRDIRLTLSRIPAEGSPLISAIMEDVTDRRALERSLQTAAPAAAATPKAPQDAFAMLAKSLQESLEAKAAKPAKTPAEPAADKAPPAPEPAAATKAEAAAPPVPPKPAAAKPASANPPGPQMPFVPKPVRQSFENTGKAILIGRGDTPLFATAKAAELLGYDSVESLLADPGLWQHFTTVMQPVRRTSLPAGDGGALDIDITTCTVPWVNGPAEQFVLNKALSAASDSRHEAKTAPAAPPPVETPAAPAAVAVSAPKPEPEPEPEPPSPRPVPAAEVSAAPLAPVVPGHEQQVMATNELKAMLDVASDGIIALDGTGSILSFSAGAEAIFGMTQDEVRGRPFADLLCSDARKAWRDYLSALNGPGLASVFNDGREFMAIVKQGGTVPLFVTLGKLQSPHSQASFCAVVRDITQWKRTEQELREAKEAADHANRQKSEFLAGISHEIRTPLNAILGFSDVMRTERFGELRNEKYRAYANDIHASGSHLLALVNDLLDLSKVEAGKLELDFTAVNVADAIEHVLRLLNEEAARANVVVRKSLAPGLPRVVADLRALRQVLLNLLSNAIKYTDAGGQVIVSAQMNDAGDVVVRIKDSGIGMTAVQLQEALMPYVRVEAAGRSRQGTGLGLPLSKALAEANRAQFTIASEPGQGTLAEVRFPATRVLAE